MTDNKEIANQIVNLIFDRECKKFGTDYWSEFSNDDLCDVAMLCLEYKDKEFTALIHNAILNNKITDQLKEFYNKHKKELYG